MQNCAQLFRIFCATFSTNVAQLLDFLSATFWGDWLVALKYMRHSTGGGATGYRPKLGRLASNEIQIDYCKSLKQLFHNFWTTAYQQWKLKSWFKQNAQKKLNLRMISRHLRTVKYKGFTVDFNWTELYFTLVSPPRKLRMLRSATFVQLSRFRASAQFLPRSATFAQLWLILACFLRFSSILETFWGKMENVTFEHPQSFRHL